VTVLRRAQEDEHRAKALPARCERFLADRGDDAGMRLDRALEPCLENVEVLVQPASRADVGQRRCHSLTPVCSATIPPANRRYSTSRKPAICAARSSGPGKRRTLAGRYVYASPPGSTLPSSGTMRSNHSE